MKVTSDVWLDVCNVKLNKAVENLWDLESLGIQENVLVYEKFLDKVEYKNEQYDICFPFKESRLFLEDNFALNEQRLHKLKGNLDKNQKVYDAIMKEHLAGRVVQKVETEQTIEVTYLQRHAVVRDDKKMTKVRIIFDASAKIKGPSLNESLYKGQLLRPMLFDVLL